MTPVWFRTPDSDKLIGAISRIYPPGVIRNRDTSIDEGTFDHKMSRLSVGAFIKTDRSEPD